MAAVFVVAAFVAAAFPPGALLAGAAFVAAAAVLSGAGADAVFFALRGDVVVFFAGVLAAVTPVARSEAVAAILALVELLGGAFRARLDLRAPVVLASARVAFVALAIGSSWQSCSGGLLGGIAEFVGRRYQRSHRHWHVEGRAGAFAQEVGSPLHDRAQPLTTAGKARNR